MNAITNDTNTQADASIYTDADTGLLCGRFMPYVASIGDSYVAATGRRLVKLQFKAAVSGANKGKTAAPNSYITVPDHITPASVTSKIDDLMPVFIHMLQEHESLMLRKELVAGTKSLSDSGMTLDKIVASLQETGAGRLTKEQIIEWFKSVRKAFYIVFADALGYDHNNIILEQESILLATCEVFESKFAALASPSTSYVPDEAAKLVKYMELAEVSGTGIGARILPRLAKMVKVTESDLLAAL